MHFERNMTAKLSKTDSITTSEKNCKRSHTFMIPANCMGKAYISLADQAALQMRVCVGFQPAQPVKCMVEKTT